MAIIVWVAVPSCSYCLKLPSAPLSPLSLSPPNFKKMFDLAFVNYHLSIQPPKRMRLNAFLTTLPSPTNRVLKAHGCWFTEEQEIPYREEIVARFRIPEVGRCRLRNVPQKTPFIEREILVKIWWSTRKAKLWAQRTFFSRLSVSKRQPTSMRVQIFDTWLSGSRTTVKLMVLWVHWNQQNDASSVVPTTSCGESKHKKAVKPSHWALFVLVKLVAWDRHCCTSS